MSVPVGGHDPDFVRLAEEARATIREISVDEYRQEPVPLVDVREESEYVAQHARGALHLSRGVLERDIASRFPDKQAPLALYCGGGYRSALAAANLQRMGYSNVRSIAGGWRAIEPSGIPLEPASKPEAGPDITRIDTPDVKVVETTIDPGSPAPVNARDHWVYVLAGKMAARSESEAVDLLAGASVHVMAGDERVLFNPGPDPARLLLISSTQ